MGGRQAGPSRRVDWMTDLEHTQTKHVYTDIGHRRMHFHTYAHRPGMRCPSATWPRCPLLDWRMQATLMGQMRASKCGRTQAARPSQREESAYDTAPVTHQHRERRNDTHAPVITKVSVSLWACTVVSSVLGRQFTKSVARSRSCCVRLIDWDSGMEWNLRGDRVQARA